MSASPAVDAWFAQLDHPLKEAMQRVRELILDADPRIDETVKWSTPTFTFVSVHAWRWRVRPECVECRTG